MAYVESNLGKNEVIVKKADLNPLFLLGAWIKGILFFWLLFIPLIKAVIATIRFFNIELAITNKRIIGKVGVLNTSTLDTPLNKIQTVGEKQPFFGKIFNYSKVTITTAAGVFTFDCIKSGAQFKNMIMAQADQFEEDRIKQQANEMANAMANAINK
ncbi:MAG: PH domain-containing protein [Clostridiales bacterium]|nr:PH domain-containing protein [Clostridiales bacterium]